MATAMKGLLSLILLLVILLSSWLVAVLLDYYTGHGKPLKPHKRTNSAPFPSEKLENIFWFVQISDIHISKYRGHQRAYDLKQFCNENIDVIRPIAVLATGDLTDAKDAYKLGSMQYREEWEVYYNVLKETKVEQKTKWLDLRGNHGDNLTQNLLYLVRAEIEKFVTVTYIGHDMQYSGCKFHSQSYRKCLPEYM